MIISAACYGHLANSLLVQGVRDAAGDGLPVLPGDQKLQSLLASCGQHMGFCSTVVLFGYGCQSFFTPWLRSTSSVNTESCQKLHA